MQYLTLVTLLVAGSATALANLLDKRVNEKANEYVSTDCSGNINFSHYGGASTSLGNVNMDPSSHSVYLAGATWSAWSAPNLNGDGNGACAGEELGPLSGGCNDLDNAFSTRVACVLD